MEVGDIDAASAAEVPKQQFTDALELALSEALPSDDPLDHSSFNPLDFVNTAFPNGMYGSHLRRSNKQ